MVELRAAVQLAAQFEETRSTMRRLFGDEYAAKVAPYRELVCDIARSRGIGPAQVLPALQRDGELDRISGASLGLLIAATADEIEAQ